MASRGNSSRVTLATVAEHAGVALSTASIVLRENSAYLSNFSQATIERVQASAEKLGYRPSLFASGLPTRGASVFFVVALYDQNPTLSGDRFLWGFDGDLLGGVAEAALRSRVYPIIALMQSHAADSTREHLDQIVGGGVFGAVVRSPRKVLEASLRQYIQRSHPVVVVFPERVTEWKTNVIDVDNVELGRRAGGLLAAQNRRRWLIILDEQNESHALRLRGFKSQAGKHRAKLEVLPCQHGMEMDEAARNLVRPLAEFRPDGLFALTSRTAEGSLLACREAGLTVGTHALVIGCDCSVWHRRFAPRITSLEAPWREAGHVATRLLVQMREQGTARCPKVLLKPVLIPGDTCPGDA